MEMNDRMQSIYEEVRRRNKHDPVQLSYELQKLIDPGFTRVEGCVLLTSQEELAKSVGPSDFPDLTGYECFVNHIHIEDHFNDSIDKLDLAAQGMVLADQLKKALAMSFTGEQFRLIISVDESECNVRFHKTRSGENWLSPNLNKYNEAILVLDT